MLCGYAVMRGFCLMLDGVTMAEIKGKSFGPRDEGDKRGRGGGVLEILYTVTDELA